MNPAVIMAGGHLAQAGLGTLQTLFQKPGSWQRNPIQSTDQLNLGAWARNQGMQQYQNPYSGFQPIQKQMMNTWNQQIQPGIANQFSNLGQGNALSSGMFGSQLGAAGREFGNDLASQMAQYGLTQQSNARQLMGLGMGQEFENYFKPASQGFMGSLLGSLAGAAGNIGNMGASAYAEKLGNQPLLDAYKKMQESQSSAATVAQLQANRQARMADQEQNDMVPQTKMAASFPSVAQGNPTIEQQLQDASLLNYIRNSGVFHNPFMQVKPGPYTQRWTGQ